mmetsp:Transcript_117165/g.338736  ORF Transcript_117165/g.338736 Transcript_117165/m.338736 type:complete len:200 (+) Transcript_117165:1958-2557(+)
MLLPNVVEQGVSSEDPLPLADHKLLRHRARQQAEHGGVHSRLPLACVRVQGEADHSSRCVLVQARLCDDLVQLPLCVLALRGDATHFCDGAGDFRDRGAHNEQLHPDQRVGEDVVVVCAQRHSPVDGCAEEVPADPCQRAEVLAADGELLVVEVHPAHLPVEPLNHADHAPSAGKEMADEKNSNSDLRDGVHDDEPWKA